MYDVIEIPVAVLLSPEDQELQEEILEVEVNFHTDKKGFTYDIIDYRMNDQSVDLKLLKEHNSNLEKKIERAIIHYGFNMGEEQ